MSIVTFDEHFTLGNMRNSHCLRSC